MSAAKGEPGRPSLRVAALVLLAATLAAFGPFLYYTLRCGASCWGFHDWPQFWSWYGLPRIALVQYGQLGFWNPYVSGGIPGFGHTHDPTFSPILLVTLLFGTVTGTRLVVVVWTYLAMLSMFALARRLGVGRLGAYLAAIVWGLNGHHLLHLLVGHIEHVAMGFLPLVVLLFLRERKDGGNLLLTALLLAGLILGGAAYPAGHAALLLALLAVGLAVLERRAKWLGRLAAVGVCAGFFAAVKLVAAVPFLLTRAPLARDVTGSGLRFLWHRLTSPEEAWIVPTGRSPVVGFWELGAYVGVAVVALSGLGVIVAAWGLARGRGVLRTKGTWYLFQNPDPRWGALLAAAAVFLLLSFGSEGPVNLFGLLSHVPVLSSIHVPFRFVTVPLMAIALLAGLGLDRLARRRRAARVAAAVVIAAVAADLAWAYQRLVPAAFAIDQIDVEAGTAAASDRGRLPGHEGETGPVTVAEVGAKGEMLFEQRRVAFSPGEVPGSRRWRDHYVIEPHATARYLMLLQNRGDVVGYEMLRLRTAAYSVGDRNYRGETYLQNRHGTAELVEFSPSRITVAVEAEKDDVLVLNQNAYGGWHATIDGRTRRVAAGGLYVSVEVPAGARRVTFWYRPDGFWWGLAISVGSLAMAAARIAVVRRRLRRGASADGRSEA